MRRFCPSTRIQPGWDFRKGQVSFEQYFVDLVDLGVSATNSAAIGCYAKLGFKQVGTWPNAIAVGPGTIDVVWMTVTRDTLVRADKLA
jgi:ribosomal protein S18 acetylase RimI-like enzyme